MPTITHLLGARDPGPDTALPSSPAPTSPKENTSQTTSSTVVWIVCAVIGGIIVLGSVVVWILIIWAKRRQYKRDKELHPYLTYDEIAKRRRKNKADPFGDIEQRRQEIIRKSLATRSSGSGFESMATPGSSRGGGGIVTTMADQIDRDISEIERQEETGSRLREDWKRWEATERRKRSASGGQHPATAPHPAMASRSRANTVSPISSFKASSDVPVLQMPTPAKHRSHNRTKPNIANVKASPRLMDKGNILFMSDNDARIGPR
ncbi:hypothetical protein VTJ49DRAFT_2039 [Mycothermus thermophilus]|uniref:Uncharacterized protein n=1 Tax=Humicola insolens TaxID=85995 RepID=A0ABR3VBE5_HUMIN